MKRAPRHETGFPQVARFSEPAKKGALKPVASIFLNFHVAWPVFTG